VRASSSKAHQPAAVLFDMDGTLVDSEHLWLDSEIQVMRSLDAEWTAMDQAHCLGGPLERVAEYMARRSGTAMSVADLGQLLLDTIEHKMRTEPLQWRPGALELLRNCRDEGIPTALVTASWDVLVQALAERMHVDVGCKPFDVTVAGDHIRNSKPHPEPYETAARLLGVVPGECLAIEDSPTGVRSAVAAGCVVVAVPHIAPIDPAEEAALIVSTLHGWHISELWRRALGG